jgi:ABC-type multidrug transport system fused ATPase/permease subunit
MRAVFITASLRPLVELIGAAALALLLFIGGHIARTGALDAASLIAMVFAMDTVNQGFRNLANVSNTFASVQAASERIHLEILDLPDAPDAQGAERIESPQGRIEFQSVSFAYPDGTEALRDVSFALEPGSSLALVGPSGAGKSTIADLILRFYEPTSGQILFDGVDMSTLDAVR